MYFPNTDALIFVVDSSDRERIGECKDEVHRLSEEEDLKNAVHLVIANKQDLPNAMSVEEVADKLALQSIKNCKWRT